jgi:molybdopterin biosynthesis enzyme
VLEPVRGQDSHMIVRAAGADALVLVPRGEGELGVGAGVRFLRL